MPNHTLTVDDVATARELLAASVGKITAHGHLTRARWLDEAEQYLADGQPAEAARRHEWAVEGLVAPAPPATTYRTEDGVELATGDRHGAELELVELRAAFERVGRPKLQRVLAESYRANTPASRRTRQAWIDTAVELGLDVDVVHLSTGSSTVACGARMADTAGDGGWDLGDTSVAFRDVTCPACRLAVWRRQGISDRYLEHGGQLVEVLT